MPVNSVNDDTAVGTKYAVALSLADANDVRVMAYQLIDPNSTVLDVGCACGDFGALLTTKGGVVVHGLEYNAHSLEEAEAKGVFAQLHQVDLNTFSTAEFSHYHEHFDYIALLDVLEHTTHPEQSIQRLTSYLKPGGAFIVSLPNVSFGEVKLGILRDEFNYADTGILDRTHLRFFTAKTIAEFFSQLGLEIVSRQVKVADIAAPREGVPGAVWRYVRSRPQSYAYQYVMLVKPSQMAGVALARSNELQMSLAWSDIKKPLAVLRRANLKLRLIGSILPPGSWRRAFVKSLRERLLK